MKLLFLLGWLAGPVLVGSPLLFAPLVSSLDCFPIVVAGYGIWCYAVGTIDAKH